MAIAIIPVLEEIFSVGMMISQQISLAKINRAQCIRLGERITIIINAVRGLEQLTDNAAQRYLVPLEKLHNTLQECLTFVTAYSKKYWAKRFLLASKYESSFDNLYQQLNEDIQALDLSINTTLLFDCSQDKEDKNQDKAALAEKIDVILAANKQTLLETQGFHVAQEERNQLLLEQLASLRQVLLTEGRHSKTPHNELEKMTVDFHTLKIDSKLTAGLLGDIYLGRRYEQPVIIKAMPLVDEKNARSRFIHEVKILKGLASPYIVQLLHISETQNHCYLVMEPMKRGALADYLLSNPLPLRRRYQLAMDILLGVSYLHSHQMGHRHITPKTILVTKEGTAKLANFCFSKTLEQSIVSADELNSEGLVYFAPEIILQKKPASRMTQEDYIQADMYSVGVVLWELLTGLSYFHGLSQEDLISKLNAQEHCPISSLLPEPYQQLVESCLNYSPVKRPTAAQLIRSLRENKSLLLEQTGTANTFYAKGLQKEKEQDLSSAVFNYQVAAYYGSVRAITNLGVFYAMGQGGLPKAPKKAHQYFKQAAKRGHVRAMENLALQYKKGEGTSLVASKSIFWYQCAKQEGSQIAEKALLQYNSERQGKEV